MLPKHADVCLSLVTETGLRELPLVTYRRWFHRIKTYLKNHYNNKISDMELIYVLGRCPMHIIVKYLKAALKPAERAGSVMPGLRTDHLAGQRDPQAHDIQLEGPPQC